MKVRVVHLDIAGKAACGKKAKVKVDHPDKGVNCAACLAVLAAPSDEHVWRGKL